MRRERGRNGYANHSVRRRTNQLLVIIMRILKYILTTLAFLALYTSFTLGVDNSIWPERFRLTEPPLWTISGAWSADGTEFHLVDALRSQVRTYSRSGDLKRVRTEIQGSRVRQFRPAVIKATHDSTASYVLEADSAYLLWLDNRLRPLKELNLRLASKGDRGEIASLYTWATVEDHLIGFGDIKRPDGQWIGALFHVPLGAPSKFQILEEFAVSSSVREYYLLGLNYATILKGKGYFIAMTDPPHLLEIDLEVANGGVVAVDTGMLSLISPTSPELPVNRGLSNIGDVFSALEETSMPSGLYSHDNKIYVLVRDNFFLGHRWGLSRIALDERFVTTVPIPSRARHLVALPGDSWLFLEKGKVEGFGQQESRSVLLVPGGFFKSTVFYD